jgi:hypothetical protein
MKRLLFILIVTALALHLPAQPRTYISLAATTSQNAMPFGKFGGLFSETMHPGFEFGYGKNLGTSPKHEWFAELRLAYFYHRFVQHGLPLYVNFGYRHNLKSRFRIETSLGAGYMHSIPATSKFKLNENGEYGNNKGSGRAQAILTYGLGLGYMVQPNSTRPTRIFFNWQQRLQTPFVKSYVPILPYNNLIIGVARPLRKK